MDPLFGSALAQSDPLQSPDHVDHHVIHSGLATAVPLPTISFADLVGPQSAMQMPPFQFPALPSMQDSHYHQSLFASKHLVLSPTLSSNMMMDDDNGDDDVLLDQFIDTTTATMMANPPHESMTPMRAPSPSASPSVSSASSLVVQEDRGSASVARRLAEKLRETKFSLMNARLMLETQQQLIQDACMRSAAVEKMMEDSEREFHLRLVSTQEELSSKDARIAVLKAELESLATQLQELKDNAAALPPSPPTAITIVPTSMDLASKAMSPPPLVPPSPSPVPAGPVRRKTRRHSPAARPITPPPPAPSKLSSPSDAAAVVNTSSPASSASGTPTAAIALSTNIHQGYNRWTPEEDALLRAAVNHYGQSGRWALIAQSVPNRTPIQCSTRWTGALNPQILKGKWSPAEDAALRAAREEFTDRDGVTNWSRVAERVEGRTAVQCIARYQEALDPIVRKGKWDPEEDRVLKEGLRIHGKSWVKIADMIHGRTQRQCRTRWLQLRPKLEGVLDFDGATAVGSDLAKASKGGSRVGNASSKKKASKKRGARSTSRRSQSSKRWRDYDSDDDDDDDLDENDLDDDIDEFDAVFDDSTEDVEGDD